MTRCLKHSRISYVDGDFPIKNLCVDYFHNKKSSSFFATHKLVSLHRVLISISPLIRILIFIFGACEKFFPAEVRKASKPVIGPSSPNKRGCQAEDIFRTRTTSAQRSLRLKKTRNLRFLILALLNVARNFFLRCSSLAIESLFTRSNISSAISTLL